MHEAYEFRQSYLCIKNASHRRVFVGEVARELRSLFANVGESGSKMQATPFVHPPERVLSDTEAPQDQKQFPCLYSSHPQGGTKRKIKVTYDHQLFSSELNQSSKHPSVCVWPRWSINQGS